MNLNRTLSISMLSALAFLSPPLAHSADLTELVRLGGDTTWVSKSGSLQAYRQPATNLSAEELERHLNGDTLFERKFGTDPATPNSGLGPVYNHVSCAGCHIQDGKGMLPVLGRGENWQRLAVNATVFLRISSESNAPPRFDESDHWGAPQAVPGFSTQLFHLGRVDLREDAPGTGQGDVEIKLEWSQFTYPDGQVVELRRPLFRIVNPYDQNQPGGSRIYGADVKTGPRMTPGMIGLGLLEAITPSDILALAQRDLSALGISGKPNWVIDREKQLRGDVLPISLGRFGLKANTPSVLHQSLGALQGDMGISNSYFPEESIAGTPLWQEYLGRRPQVPGIESTREKDLDLVFYARTLAVPSMRNTSDPAVIQGYETFKNIGCVACHHDRFTTGDTDLVALSRQTIHPFTDLLLHDMGAGLADGRRDFQADGQEWRTAPLWGVGLVQVVNPRAGFLHDGRARTLEEAILWHGGEADLVRDRFANLTKSERQSLLAFLKAL